MILIFLDFDFSRVTFLANVKKESHISVSKYTANKDYFLVENIIWGLTKQNHTCTLFSRLNVSLRRDMNYLQVREFSSKVEILNLI